MIDLFYVSKSALVAFSSCASYVYNFVRYSQWYWVHYRTHIYDGQIWMFPLMWWRTATDRRDTDTQDRGTQGSVPEGELSESAERRATTGVEMQWNVTLGVRMCSITDNQNGGGDRERVARRLVLRCFCYIVSRQLLNYPFHVSKRAVLCVAAVPALFWSMFHDFSLYCLDEVEERRWAATVFH